MTRETPTWAITVTALCALFAVSRSGYYAARRARDHGPQYTGGDCRALLGRWGVAQTFSPVGRPTGNAVVERLHRTLKEEVIWLQDWEDAAEVERAVRA